jgi:hypothetical protein
MTEKTKSAFDSARGEGFNPKKIRTRTTLEAVLGGIIAFLFIILAFQAVLYFYPRIILPETLQSGNATRAIDWTHLGDITSLATFALIVGGVVFAFINYVQNAVQRKREEAEASFNIYMEMYNRMMNPQAMEARRWVIENLHTLEEMGNDEKAWLEHLHTKINEIPPDWKGNRPPGKEYLKEILNTFDFIGFVAEHYWSMENELVVWMSSPVAKVWERIHRYVKEEAKQRNEPDYYESACEFADYCMKWRQEHSLKSIVIENGT